MKKRKIIYHLFLIKTILFSSTHSLRKVKMDQRKLMDNANTLTDMAKVSLNKAILAESQNVPVSLMQVNMLKNPIF